MMAQSKSRPVSRKPANNCPCWKETKKAGWGKKDWRRVYLDRIDSNRNMTLEDHCGCSGVYYSLVKASVSAMMGLFKGKILILKVIDILTHLIIRCKM